LGALALQLWRPYYHLTDDTLSAWLPLVVEFYGKLWSGEWPFVSDTLFGGNYSWLRDPMVFSLVSPFLLVCSPLALTRFYYLVPDIVGTLILLTTAGAFCASALFLRKRLDLAISDNWIVLLSLSYTFTVFALVVNASWIMFINVHAAYPVVFAALFARSLWRGAAVIAGALVFSLLGAHPHPFCYLLIFGGLLALGVSWARRSWRPTGAFAAGSMVGIVALLPLMWPVLQGFTTSWRGGAMAIEFVRAFNVPVARLVSSWVLGPADILLHPTHVLHFAAPIYVAALAWSLINLPLLLLLLRRGRGFSRLEVVLLVVIVVCAVFIARPMWLAQLLAQLPLLRSLRWPFREIAVLHACTHLLALLCVTAKFHRVLRIGVAASLVFAAVLLVRPAPSFNDLELDREMIISGKAAAFQRVLARIYGKGSRMIISAPPEIVMGEAAREPLPFAALGSHNYAALSEMVNVAGYSSTIPESASPEKGWQEPMHWGGIYSPAQAEKMIAREPRLLHLVLRSRDPLLVESARGAERHLFRFDEETGDFTEVPLASLPRAVARR
jgi:uncharacterized membrane-anchored protein YitT (DUF2179 family)